METVIVDLGKSLHRRVDLLAKEQGISVERFCIDALKQKLGILPPDSLDAELLDAELLQEIERAISSASATGTKVLTLK